MNRHLVGSSLLGLDIRPHGLFLIELKKQLYRISANTIIRQDFTDAIFSDGKIKHWDKLQEVLSQTVAAYSLQGKTVATALPSHLVRMQKLTLPKGLTDSEIELEIKAYIQQELPGMTDLLSIDFSVLPNQDPQQINVYFTATRQEYLTRYIECIRAANLNIKIIDVDIYAIKRAVDFAMQTHNLADNATVIIYFNKQTGLLISCKEKIIASYKHWEMTDLANLPTHIEQLMQSVTSYHILICGDSQRIDLVVAEIAKKHREKIYHPNLFGHIHFANFPDHIDCTELFIAVGLALREKPQW